MSAPSLARFGIAVGHSAAVEGATGCTVVRGISQPHRAACAVIGRATGSRELALLAPGHLVERVDAVLLTRDRPTKFSSVTTWLTYTWLIVSLNIYRDSLHNIIH